MSAKKQNKDLRMISFMTISDLHIARKFLGEDLMPGGIISTKSLALLEKEGIKPKRVAVPITKSDLTPEQIQEVKSGKARLTKIQVPGLFELLFFSIPKAK